MPLQSKEYFVECLILCQIPRSSSSSPLSIIKHISLVSNTTCIKYNDNTWMMQNFKRYKMSICVKRKKTLYDGYQDRRNYSLMIQSKEAVTIQTLTTNAPSDWLILIVPLVFICIIYVSLDSGNSHRLLASLCAAALKQPWTEYLLNHYFQYLVSTN